MLKKVLIIIGSKTLELHENFTLKSDDNKFEENHNQIENKTLNEIIKRNDKRRDYTPKLIIIPTIIIILYILTNNLQLILSIIIIILLIITFKKVLPKIKQENRKKEILEKLPYALRQISTQLKAGIGLYDALKTVANSNYGALSEEFSITLKEIQYGTNYVESFEKLAKRTKSKSMEKLVSQIIRTINNGGNLSETLNTLADENSYNMRIKYKEYSEKLNAIMLLYMFIAVLLPVILFIMIIAATTVMGAVIKPEILLILYLFFFPMIIIFMIILINRMEPRIS